MKEFIKAISDWKKLDMSIWADKDNKVLWTWTSGGGFEFAVQILPNDKMASLHIFPPEHEEWIEKWKFEYHSSISFYFLEPQDIDNILCTIASHIEGDLREKLLNKYEEFKYKDEWKGLEGNPPIEMEEKNMTSKELADQLNGRQMLKEITENEEKIAKDNNLLVVFGYSDDLIEFRGSINDEAGLCDCVYIHNGKIIIIIIEDELEEDKETLSKYGITFSPDLTIRGLWCPEKLHTSWLIEIDEDIETHSFDIFENDDLFCHGMVIDLNQI